MQMYYRYVSGSNTYKDLLVCRSNGSRYAWLCEALKPDLLPEGTIVIGTELYQFKSPGVKRGFFKSGFGRCCQRRLRLKNFANGRWIFFFFPFERVGTADRSFWD